MTAATAADSGGVEVSTSEVELGAGLLEFHYLRNSFEASIRATPYATMQYRMGVVSSKLLDSSNMAIHWRKAISLAPDSQVAPDAAIAVMNRLDGFENLIAAGRTRSTAGFQCDD
jgi:hypothetical protein